MRLLLIADTHKQSQTPLPSLADCCDAVVLLGDVFAEDLVDIEQLTIPVLGVTGNNDAGTEEDHPWFAEFGIHNLHLNPYRLENITFFGFGGHTKYYFAEKLKDKKPLLEGARNELQKLTKAPAADVFITHYPLYAPTPTGNAEQGISAFRAYVERVQPTWHVHGHLHGEQRVRIGMTTSICRYGISYLEI